MKFLKPYLPYLFPIVLILIAFPLFFDGIKGVFSGIFSVFDERIKPSDSLFSSSFSTLTDSHAKSLADGFYVSMADNGTHLKALYSVFDSIKTQDNFNKVYKFFGKRLYIPFAGEGDGLFGQYYDLLFWLNNELTHEEKSFVKLNYPKISIF